MTKSYSYEFEGTGREGRTWKYTGALTTTSPGAFMLTVEAALRDTFNKVTEGKAEYGKPGYTCDGPYQITRFEVKEIGQ